MNLKIYETEININPDAISTFDFYPLTKTQLEDLNEYHFGGVNSKQMVMNLAIDKRTDLLMYFAVLGCNTGLQRVLARMAEQKLKDEKRFKDE